jgi:hypothetical protein
MQHTATADSVLFVTESVHDGSINNPMAFVPWTYVGMFRGMYPILQVVLSPSFSDRTQVCDLLGAPDGKRLSMFSEVAFAHERGDLFIAASLRRRNRKVSSVASARLGEAQPSSLSECAVSVYWP